MVDWNTVTPESIRRDLLESLTVLNLDKLSAMTILNNIGVFFKRYGANEISAFIWMFALNLPTHTETDRTPILYNLFVQCASLAHIYLENALKIGFHNVDDMLPLELRERCEKQNAELRELWEKRLVLAKSLAEDLSYNA